MKDKDTVFVVDYQNRTIWLDGSISVKIAKKFKKALSRLNKISYKHIIFYIRGPGGDPYATFTMMGDMSMSVSPIVTVSNDYVRSGCFTITQAGSIRLALKGTKFYFHPAIATISKGSITQDHLVGMVEGLRLLDAVQLVWFSRKGRPVKKIHNLLISEATIGLSKAIKHKIMDGYYKEEDFIKDKKSIKKIIRKQNKS